MSGANYQPGQVLTAAELNASLNSKTDNSAAAITGGTIVGLNELQVSGTANTSSPETGVVVVAGGVGIALDVQIGGGVTAGGAVITNNNTPSTSTTTGALVVTGGAGIGGGANVGGSVAVGGSLAVQQQVAAQQTTDSSSVSTGAIVVSGGVGIAKKLNVGSDASIGGQLSVTGAANLSGVLTVTTVNIGAGGVITIGAGGSIMFPDGTSQSSAGGNSEALITTTGGTTVINATQNNANIFKVSGTLTSNAILIFPATAKSFVVYNNTTGAFSLTIEANGQSPLVVVPQGKAVSLFCDSTGCYAAGSTGSGIGFTSIITPGANITLTAQQAGAYVVQKIAGTTTKLPQASTLQAGQGFLFKDAIGGSILALNFGTDTAEIAMPYTCTVGDEFLLVSDGVSKYSVALWVNNVWVKVSGGIIFPDGSQQTTAQGNTNATTVSYTVGATDTVGSFAAGDTALRTAGFVAPFAELIYNGLVCTIGVHYTLNADGLHLNWLGDPFKTDDQITVKTRFPYNPSTVYVPGMQGFATTVGQTFIPYPHVQGFAYLLNVGGWLRPGIDYTDDNTGFYLQGWSADATTELSVFALNPVTIANVLASSNPVITGGSLTYPDGSVQNTAPRSNRNGFIDGVFSAWSYGAANPATLPASTGGFVGPAMWRVGAGVGGAGNVALLDERSVSDLAILEGEDTVNAIKVSITTGSTGTVAARSCGAVYQAIEYASRYAGKSVTLQFKLKVDSGTVTIPSVIAAQNFGTGGSPSATVILDKAVNWVVGTTLKKFSVRVDFPSVIGKTFGTNIDHCLYVGLWLPPGVTFNLTVAEAQIESSSPSSSPDINGAGGSPTPFESRGLQAENARIQRHYQSSQQCGWIGYQGGANSFIGQWHSFPVVMRSTPAVTLGTPIESNNVGTIATSVFGPEAFRIYSTSGTVVGNSYYSNTFTADARL